MNQYPLIKGKTDLETIRPDLARQWDYERNDGLKPCDVQPGTDRKVWWKCDKGHSWEARVYSRNYGNGCPFCAGNILERGVNDFATKAPELVKEWDYDKNQPWLPTEVSAGSSKKVWWKCQKGHSWEAVISSRALNGRRCPFCCNKRVLAGYNDLQYLAPDIASEWDHEKNGNLKPTDVTQYSHAAVWWKGKCGHGWKAQIANRSNGAGCPYCDGKKVLYGFNDVESQCPDLLAEWDKERNVKKPSETYCNTTKKLWWRCEKGHSWQAPVYSRRKGEGCPVCCNKKIIAGINDLASMHPELLNEWDYEKNNGLSPAKVGYRTDRCVWWKCNKGHSFKTSVYNRHNGTGCPFCVYQTDKHRVSAGINDLKTYSPKIAEEWDYQRNGELTPEKVMPFSNRKVWWVCERGHHWQCSVQIRQRGTGCPYCIGKVHRGSKLI